MAFHSRITSPIDSRQRSSNGSTWGLHFALRGGVARQGAGRQALRRDIQLCHGTGMGVTSGYVPTWVSVGSLPGCRPWPGGLDYPEGSASVGGVSEGQSQGEPFSIVRGFVRVKHQEAREFFQGKRGRVGRQPSLT